MKCCGSPTISTARNDASTAEQPHVVAAQFAGLLMQQAFAPLAKAIGFYGDAVVAVAAQSMVRGQRGGLGDALDRVFESASRDGIASSDDRSPGDAR